MDPRRSEERVQAAITAVQAGSRLARSIQVGIGEALHKADQSPVTVADFAVQAVVAHALEETLGAVVLVGEESASDARRDPRILGATVEAVRSVWPDATAEGVLAAIDRGSGEPRREGFWTLDPIDGTKGFLRRQQYCIALAYLEEGRPLLGVLGCPNLPSDPTSSFDHPDERGCVYYAVAGEGAFDFGGARLRASVPSEVITFCESVEEAHSDQEANLRLVEALGVREVRSVRLDSQCKYAVVARGQADAYLRLPRSETYVEKIWDHAAGSLIAIEAGCSVTDARGEALDFSLGRRLENNRGVVVATRALHARLIAAL